MWIPLHFSGENYPYFCIILTLVLSFFMVSLEKYHKNRNKSKDDSPTNSNQVSERLKTHF
jgi:hypothetical protein